MASQRSKAKRLYLALFLLTSLGLSLFWAWGLWGQSFGLGNHALSTNTPAVMGRDPWLWPFTSNSIWNHPIGSQANYHPAQLPKANVVSTDPDLLFVIPRDSPARLLYDPGSWLKRCSGTTTYENLSIQIPDGLIVPDAVNEPGRYETPNNAAALLQPDGRTILQLEPMARCDPQGPVYGYRWPKQNVDLYGDGIPGSHLGSGLSALGGAIRKGELLSKEPIRHALKLEFWGKYLHYDAKRETPGYRWPADRADGQAASIYEGSDPELVMGSLMAIPPATSIASLGLKTDAGRKIAEALRDFGGYVVDSTGWDAHAIAIEAGVEQELQRASGYGLSGNASNPTKFYGDFNRIVQALAIVTDNRPEQPGGAGTPRTDLAPPLPSPPPS
ncbi:MAG: hypothetical protein HC824_00125 [Synechococcales cyanobacterium RM1_1_8]|nr:hypothetical protein [Synechococcales cyanobacterium RM1_1_8]